jgi:hypothetical protein
MEEDNDNKIKQVKSSENKYMWEKITWCWRCKIRKRFIKSVGKYYYVLN